MTGHRAPSHRTQRNRLYELGVREIAGQFASPVAVDPCPVCGTVTALPRFAAEGFAFQLIACTTCGLGRLEPQPSPDELLDFYPQEYYGADGRKFQGLVERIVRMVGARHARFLARFLKPGARVLDVGCGRGIALQALAERGFDTHGFEIVTSAVENIDSRIRVRLAPSLAEAGYPANYFDEVILWHVLEHVPQPRALLDEIYRLLKPQGVLIVAVPNFSSLQARWAKSAWFHLDLPRHVYHFSLAALHELLSQCGFVSKSTHHFSLRQNPFGWVQSGLNRLHWLPRNGLYTLLHRREPGQPAPFSPAVRLQLRLAYWMCMLPAVGLSILAALLHRGATMHVVAVRK